MRAIAGHNDGAARPIRYGHAERRGYGPAEETQGREAINAIRAAGAIKETGASRKAIIYGWSQGAAAALAAASNPDDLARKGAAFDGIDLMSAVAMAPRDFRTLAPQGQMTDATGQAMLAGVAKSFSNSVNNFNHVVMTLWGAQAAYPDKLKLSDVFNADSVKFVDEVMGNKCVHASSDTISYSYSDKRTSLLRTDR